MAFSFKRKERAARAIPRLGCERAQRARDCLAACSDTEAIHEARKEIKRARAVLRLARPNVRKKEFREVRKQLRKAAAQLAKPRDADVKAITLREMTRRFKTELPPGPFRNLRVKLRRDAERQMDKFLKDGERAKVDRALRRAAKGFRQFTLNADGWDALTPGVEAVYRECREAYRRALQTNSSEDFHEWRKSAKQLWYQLKLLEQIWPEQMNRMVCELETVGEYLGEDHDLFMLEETLEHEGRSQGGK